MDHPSADGRETLARHAAEGPLYAEVKRKIVDKIRSGEWEPDSRVPSENELVAQWGISKMTANRALRELANEGQLVRRKGVGSFVATLKGRSDLVEVRNIADEITGRRHAYEATLVLLAGEQASPEIADQLRVPISERVFHSLIVHHENGVPVQLEDRFVNAAAVPDYLQQDFTHWTPNAYLSAIAPLSGSEHIVEAVLPQLWECRLLVIQKTEPCLLVRRRTASAGTVVSVAKLLYPGSRYQLTSRRGTELPAGGE